MSDNVFGRTLTPVAADIWEGFIFIHLDPQPQESLKEYLGEWGQQLHGYPFAEASEACYSWTTEVRANWKTIKDAFQEAYHVAFRHKRSLPDSFTSPSNPFCHSLAFQLYPRHQSWSLYGNPAHQLTAVEALAARFGSILMRNEFALERLPAAVNPTTSPSWSLDINILFPNCFVDVSAGWYNMHRLWPLAVDRTLWEFRSYYPRATSAGQRFSQEYGNVMFRDVLLEDASTLEQTQSMLASGAKTHFILQDQEVLIRHDHNVREEFMGFYRGGGERETERGMGRR